MRQPLTVRLSRPAGLWRRIVVAASFIPTAADADHLLDRLHTAGADDLDLVLKIETSKASRNSPRHGSPHASPGCRRSSDSRTSAAPDAKVC